jgi:UDP-2-acetamido-3-amino-2,3-dideoxy-glucuronate N-acetyltransferase
MEAPKFFVHESSYVDDGAIIGNGTKIWHFSHVMPGAVIGERCNLGQNVVVMPGTKIGNNVKIQNNVSIYEGVELEDDVFCGPSCVFTNVLNPRSAVSRKNEYKPTRVRRGTSIGANATIVCGVTLGPYAFIGAGAVVTSDAPAFGLMVGVPARRVGWMCECGERLALSGGRGACAACGATYEEAAGTLRQLTPSRQKKS